MDNWCRGTLSDFSGKMYTSRTTLRHSERLFQISAQRKQLLKRSPDGVRCVVFMKRLSPVLAVKTELNGGLGRGETRAPAIHGLHSNGIERFYCVMHRVQVGMQQPNESPPKEKIKSAEGNQRRRIVKQRACGFLYQPAL